MPKKDFSLRFPQDILRFLYWIFFKPFTLRRYFHKIDPVISPKSIGGPNLWYLFRHCKDHPEFVTILRLSFFHIIVTPFFAFPIAMILQLFGVTISWIGVTVGVVVGVAGGAAIGVTIGVTVGVAVGVALGVARGAVVGVAIGVAIGMALGVAVGMASDVASDMAYSLSFGMALGLAGSVVFGIAGGVTYNVATGVVVGVVFLLSYMRVPIYLVQIPWSLIQNQHYREGGLASSPVVWDEMIWFPLPGLDSLLVKIGKRDRQESMEAIAYVAGSFNQQRAAKNALLELIALDIGMVRTLEDSAKITQNLNWLPDSAHMDEMQDFLLGVEQASQHAHAALESETLYNRQEQLRMGAQVIDRMRSGLALSKNSAFARQMLPALAAWKKLFEHELSQANLQGNIPNVYVSGAPLMKESKVFKGRRDLFRTLTNELVTPAVQRPALLLFGARRMGKTSTLKQLPVQLGPQIIPVAFDLQKAGTVESAPALLSLLSREMVKIASQERHLSLPELAHDALEKDAYLAFQEWLGEVEAKLGDDHWILLALDEFESLGEMLSAGRVDERIFQLLRGVIQGHPRITVLLSGAHTLEELPPLWSNYFINTKTIKVSPLSGADARELITRPIPDFPLTYDDDALDLILQETGGHPNWLQCACRDIVGKKNDADRFHATREDVEAAIQCVPETLAGDFKDFWEGHDSTPAMRALLSAIAKSKNLSVSMRAMKKTLPDEEALQRTLQFLLRRDVLVMENDACRFRANLLRRWVAKQ